MDQTVTKILAFEGDGNIECHVGGYTDYLNFKKAENKRLGKEEVIKAKKNSEKKAELNQEKIKKPNTKISFKIKHEYEKLPDIIEGLEQEIMDMLAEIV